MITIREALQDDLPLLFAYLGEQLTENGNGGMPLFQPMARTSEAVVPEAMRARFADGLATPLGQPGWRRAWIAVDEQGTVAGHIDLRARPEPLSAHRALLGMGVRTDCRRDGLGTRLVATALEWARATPPLEWVDLDVLSANSAARRLYERSGFQVVGEIEDLYRIDGESVSSLLMARPLNRP